MPEAYDLSIREISTRKDKIKQPDLAEAHLIPRINSSCLFVGSSGSGKSTVLANLVTRKDMLGKAFDRIFLFSPTAKTDDIQMSLNLDDDDIEDDLTKVPEMLEEIFEDQRAEIEELGADKASKILIIYDDVVADKDLLKHPLFTRSFILNRHVNATTFLCSQSYKQIPRRCRLQASNIIYFAGSNSENESIMEDRCPPNFSRKDGLALVQFATREKWSFLHINMRVPFAERYRRNFDELIHVADPLDEENSVQTTEEIKDDSKKRKRVDGEEEEEEEEEEDADHNPKKCRTKKAKKSEKSPTRKTT